MLGRGVLKCKYFGMFLNLNYYQCKESRYSDGLTYSNSMVITNKKYTVDSQKPKRKKLKHTTKENHQATKRKKKKKRTKNYKKQLENKD